MLKVIKWRLFWMFGFIFCNLVVQAQEPDSTILSYEEYLINILNYHPVAKRANLKLELADLEWLSAKGNLDPTIDADWNQKSFDDKRYYRIFRNRLRVPTKYGVAFVAGYENTEGIFLNPEDKTDKFGLWNIGIEIDILQGLLVNERRIALDQASVMQDMALNQQQILLNELLYTASEAYLEWQKFFYIQSVLLENEVLAAAYLENTKQSFFGGEKTAMDTLEAFILLQDAVSLTNYNDLELQNSRQMLENFLWFNELPLELQITTKPDDYQREMFTVTDVRNIRELARTNPLILEKINKQSLYELELRLKREKLKPKLKAKINPLIATNNNLIPRYNASDYKLGFEFSMPLFLRSERADVKMGEIKIQDGALDIQNKQNELLNKIESNLLKQVILRDQVALVAQNVEGYKQLLDGENEKFFFGESSVFLLNKRQEKYIDGRIKLIELNLKLNSVLLKYLYFINDLIRNGD